MSIVNYYKCDNCRKTAEADELNNWIHIGLEDNGRSFRLGIEAGCSYLPAIGYGSLDFCCTDCLVWFVKHGREKGRKETDGSSS